MRIALALALCALPSLAQVSGTSKVTPDGNAVVPVKSGMTCGLTVTDDGTAVKYACANQFGLSAVPVAVTPSTYTTWYVRPDGGTRAQCDGKGDNAISADKHCAYADVRYLYQTDNYPGTYKWAIAGGDTVIIRGALKDGVTYRIGWSNKDRGDDNGMWMGVAGNPYGSGMPVPPSGTSAQHTRILGENYVACSQQNQRTQLHGGFGTYSVVDLSGAAYVDMQCLDITDFSQCGRSGQMKSCNTNPGTLDDYATNGITVNNKTTNVLVQDVRVHGMAGNGMAGATGNAVTFKGLDLVGNAAAGWQADDGTVGVGTTLVQNFNISWNGCAEEYPITYALPYQDCADDNAGGYGDGFGTATINSTVPWNITFDTGIASFNTQDGLDALHLIGAGSSITIRNTQAYSNMGQQLKAGGANTTFVGNAITTNCRAMQNAIPGTPASYNSRLSDFCRAADTGVALAVANGSKAVVTDNTMYSSAATGWEIDCASGTCDKTALIDFERNTFYGFLGSSGQLSNPIYGFDAFSNAGSVTAGNLFLNPRSLPAWGKLLTGVSPLLPAWGAVK